MLFYGRGQRDLQLWPLPPKLHTGWSGKRTCFIVPPLGAFKTQLGGHIFYRCCFILSLSTVILRVYIYMYTYFHRRLIRFPSNLHVTGFSSCRITSMIHSYLVCVLWGSSLSLFCNNTVVNSDRSHGLWFVCHLWTDWNFPNCFLEMEGQLSALRFFGGSVTGFKAQKLRLMPSSLEADEVKGDGSYGCSYLIVWLVGEFDCSLVHAVLIRTFSGILFRSFWNSVQLEGLQAQCTGTFWTFTLCKLGALAATKFYVQDISLQYWLWTSKGGVETSISCGRHPQYNV